MTSALQIQTVEALELELTRLAAWFRGLPLERRSEAVVAYQATLHQLHQMGWEEALPFEDELPDEYMPTWYRHKYPAIPIAPEDWER